MYIKLRGSDGKQAVITVSKTDTITSLKSKVEQEFGISQCKQRLFFAGKQLEDGYKLFDYKINVNDTIQIMKKPDIDVQQEAAENGSDPVDEEKSPSEIPCDSPYFKIGDVVDACDATHGAWFEGRLIDIVKCPPDNDIYYKVQFSYIPSAPTLVDIKNIRPISRNTLTISSLKENDMVMVNYNLQCPEDIGYWYDLKVKQVVVCDKTKSTYVEGTLFAGVDKSPMDGMTVLFPDEIMEIVENKLITEKTPEEIDMMQTEPAFKRKTAPLCDKCKDNPRRKCRQCSCEKCGGKEEPDKQIVCDECESSYHFWCVNPPLKELPPGDWYCHDCRNDDKEVVKAGEKLKNSSKKAKMASSNPKSNRDWGRGMACVGRTKECNLVGKNHFGPIPGVEVGTMWKYRFQVSESGVHRPHVAGIHGRDTEGAFSIALSGGYEDDIDNGDEFLYTGSGGRDLSGNKRTAEQSCDQLLTRMNKALAKNCNAKLSEEGAEASDWKKGKPVRVVRNYKLSKHSKYAPTDGNRYDGIYKVVKYYPVKGKSGYRVWRYLFRRDDPAPAPWTKEGKARIASLGLKMQYPDSYMASGKTGSDPKEKRVIEEDEAIECSLPKKMKISYTLDNTVMEAIAADEVNAKLWTSLQELTSSGQRAFLDKVEEEFRCVVCMSMVYQPVTTSCSHNICRDCLKRSFDANITSCPSCRTELGSDAAIAINKNLSEALLLLFPGYTASH